MIDKYSINKTQAWVNKNQFPIEGETKTYKEIKQSLGWKGGEYEDYKTKKEAEKAWDSWDKWHRKHKHKYWSWGYYQWNNITYKCLRCGLLVENGTGYSGEKTIEDFEKDREESAEKYCRDYKSKENVPYYLYCEVDSDLKGYNGAYVKGNIRGYWFFDGGRDSRCASSNFCLGDKKTRDFLLDKPENQEEVDYIKSLDDSPKCLTDFAWEEWLKRIKKQGKQLYTNKREKFSNANFTEKSMAKLMFGGEEVNYSKWVLDYRAFKVWFDEWVKDKEDICKKADELRWKHHRGAEQSASKEA